MKAAVDLSMSGGEIWNGLAGVIRPAPIVFNRLSARNGVWDVLEDP
jgi:hypothetical protein